MLTDSEKVEIDCITLAFLGSSKIPGKANFEASFLLILFVWFFFSCEYQQISKSNQHPYKHNFFLGFVKTVHHQKSNLVAFSPSRHFFLPENFHKKFPSQMKRLNFRFHMSQQKIWYSTNPSTEINYKHPNICVIQNADHFVLYK